MAYLYIDVLDVYRTIISLGTSLMKSVLISGLAK